VIPAKTLEAIGGLRPMLQFVLDDHYHYLLKGDELAELEALMRRFAMETPLDSDEMRDWMSRLHAMLRRAGGT
jgi:hypothetical protein